MPGHQLEDFVDTGGDRFGDHMEVSELSADGREFGRRVLLGGSDQQLSAGRYWHQDDPHWQKHHQHHRVEGNLGGARTEYVPGRGEDFEIRDRRAELLPVRLDADGRSMWRAHLPLPGSEEHFLTGGARGVDIEDWRRSDLLFAAARD